MTPLPWSLHLLASPALTITVEEHVPRPWRERLLTWPWRPWQTTRLVSRTVPDPHLYRFGSACVLAHPATLARFRNVWYRETLRAEGRLN